jgi:hypothetical protein
MRIRLFIVVPSCLCQFLWVYINIYWTKHTFHAFFAILLISLASIFSLRCEPVFRLYYLHVGIKDIFFQTAVLRLIKTHMLRRVQIFWNMHALKKKTQRNSFDFKVRADGHQKPFLTIYYYLAGCTMLPHLFAPIDNYSNLLTPVASVIPVFLHQSLFSHQSSNPFRPGKFRSTSFSSSWWTLFRNFFWQPSLFHPFNMPITLKLFCFKIVWKRPCYLHFLFNDTFPYNKYNKFYCRFINILDDTRPVFLQQLQMKHPNAVTGW